MAALPPPLVAELPELLRASGLNEARSGEALWETLIDQHSGRAFEAVGVERDDPCWFFFTSGTTGQRPIQQRQHIRGIARIKASGKRSFGQGGMQHVERTGFGWQHRIPVTQTGLDA